MRAPSRLHALIVLGRFERLRVFATRAAAEQHRRAQIRRLRDSPQSATTWEDAELVSYQRVHKFRRKKR